MLQYGAVRCTVSVLRCVALLQSRYDTHDVAVVVCCSMLHCVALWCSVLQSVALLKSRYDTHDVAVAVCCSMLQSVAR